MLKVLLQPTLEQVGLDNGVGQVIANHLRYFPQVDIEIVNEKQSYDLSASHLGYNVNADVHHNHGLWLGGIGPDRADQNAMIIESVRRARQIIVPSNYVAAYFKRDMRIEPNVIGHGVNWEEWQNADNRGYILWDKNRPSDVCDPHPVSVLAKYNQSLSFVTTFVEEGVTLPNIRQIGRIPFEKMRRIVLGAHIYLATTKETFGIATLQAMAAGIPVVGYNWGGTADIVRNGIDGALAEPGNEDQLNERSHLSTRIATNLVRMRVNAPKNTRGLKSPNKCVTFTIARCAITNRQSALSFPRTITPTSYHALCNRRASKRETT